MAEPKKKSSHTRSGNRQSHDRIVGKSGTKCQNCGAKILSHRVCPVCGFYKSKKIVNVK